MSYGKGNAENLGIVKTEISLNDQAVWYQQKMQRKIRYLEKQYIAATNMLEYERNKFQRLLEMKEAGIAEELSENLSLELQAIYDIAEYVDDDNKRRIVRRLNRINDILDRFVNGDDRPEPVAVSESELDKVPGPTEVRES